MALSRKSKMLIVTSDYGIKQLPTEGLCTTRYKNCVQCVHDPYCGWNREKGECQKANSYLLQVRIATKNKRFEKIVRIFDYFLYQRGNFERFGSRQQYLSLLQVIFFEIETQNFFLLFIHELFCQFILKLSKFW